MTALGSPSMCGAYNNQPDHQPLFPPVEDTLGMDGMPLVRYRRMPWFGVSNASFIRKLLEVVSIPPKQNNSSGKKSM
jgi:hypothetical protein